MRKTLMISAMALVALTPAAGEAAREKADKSCPKDAICVWAKAGYRGERVVVQGEGVSNRIGNKLNNKASSIKNGFDQTILVYDKRNAEGESRCVSGMGKVRNLGNSYVYDNRITSSDVPDNPAPCV